jgi:hypothetical protein
VDDATNLWRQKYEETEVTFIREELPSVTTEPDEYDLLARELDLISSHSTATSDDFNDFINRDPTPLPPHTTALEWWLRPEQQWDSLGLPTPFTNGCGYPLDPGHVSRTRANI